MVVKLVYNRLDLFYNAIIFGARASTSNLIPPRGSHAYRHLNCAHIAKKTLVFSGFFTLTDSRAHLDFPKGLNHER